MPTVVTLVDWIILAALALVIPILISLRIALSRLEARLDRMARGGGNPASQATNAADSEARESAFEQFLAEDPGRISMPKSEQFAAYRQWRKDKGMNWSG